MASPQNPLTNLNVLSPEEFARQQLRQTKLRLVQQMLGLTDVSPFSSLRAIPHSTEAARLVAASEGERSLEPGPSRLQQALSSLQDAYSSARQHPLFGLLFPDLSSPAGALAAVGGPVSKGKSAFEVFSEDELLDLYSHASSIAKRIYNTLKARIGPSSPLSEAAMEVAETNTMTRLAELLQNKPVTDKAAWLREVQDELAKIASDTISAEARAPIAAQVNRVENLAEEGLEAAARGVHKGDVTAPVGELLPVKKGRQQKIAKKVLLEGKPVYRALEEIGEGIDTPVIGEVTKKGKDMWASVREVLEKEGMADITPTTILLQRGIPSTKRPPTPPANPAELDALRGMTIESLSAELPAVFSSLPSNEPTRNIGPRVAKELLIDRREPGRIARGLGYRTKEQKEQFYRLLTRIINHVYDHFGVK